ncbi:MAG: ribose 5-phosphate isomerase B [Brevinematales bacterium]|jgi:ribose 5-phosphate isomerase B
MKIALACDHAGYRLKEEIKSYLERKGYEPVDFGTFTEERMDYPDTVKLAARAVGGGECPMGVLVCASGIGASIVANKIRGVRAVLCLDEYTAEFSRRHNDANMLALAGKRNTMTDVSRFLDLWLSTPFDGGRHKDRVEKITNIEKEES